jgi:drug/metabolite transporter (DMT)-like permease
MSVSLFGHYKELYVRVMGLGLVLAVLSAATSGTSGTFATSLMNAGWSPAAAVTIRVSIAALVLTIPALLALRGRWSTLRTGWPVMAAFGLVAVALCQLCYFNAVRHLSVGVALLLEYSGTFLVVAWMWWRHQQTPGPRTIAGGLSAIAGLVLVLHLTGQQHLDGVGVLWGLGAASGLAVFYVLSARVVDDLPPIVMAWGGMVVGALTMVAVGAVGLVPMRANTASVELAGHRTSWIVPALGLAVLAAAIAYAVGIGAARHLGARIASFVGLSEVLFAILFAWALVGERPGIEQAVGGLFVVAGIALVRTDREPAGAPAAVTGVAGDAPGLAAAEAA